MARNSFKKILVCLLSVLLVLSTFGCTSGKKGDDEEVFDRGYFFDYGNSSSTYYNASNWALGSNTGKLNTTVAKGSRDKWTKILGNGKDVVTIMVYMCGADLESKSSMGTKDLQEMAVANIGKNVNLLVYLGGCTNWHNEAASSKYNSIIQVTGNGEVDILVENAGTGSMVEPDTLVSFIEFCHEHFPANRNDLIFWDHGSGSISGYGYDEKYPRKGAMGLDGIDSALTRAGVKFDFIGFDACLMGTVENALMLSEHADYLIASEEVEPGIGWYYTDWLTALSKNTSMPTIEIGKNIIDTFVSTCKARVPKQSATLSIVDLAEVANTIPDALSQFSKSATALINDNQYKKVVAARSGCREFGTSSSVDMIDLADFANSIGNTESKNLINALLSCVKYNNTSSGMNNSYGLSIYFPYRSTKYVNKALTTYATLDTNNDYSECVRSFVTYQSSGQVSSGGNNKPSSSLTGSYNTSQYQQQSTGDMVMDLLNTFVNSGSSTGGSQQSFDPYSMLINYGIQALLGGGRTREAADYIANNHFDVDLNWKNGKIAISEKQWSMIENIKLNMFIDDGKGYIDLGTDYIWEVDKNGNLCQLTDPTWFALSADGSNWQIVSFYYTDSTIDGDNVIVKGTIPVLLNGSQANLIAYMDNDVIEIVGATYTYKDETDTVAKSLESLTAGDVVQPICDYYNYDGSYVDNFTLGNPLTVETGLYLGDVNVKDKYLATYQITDIYQQNYWTAPMK